MSAPMSSLGSRDVTIDRHGSVANRSPKAVVFGPSVSTPREVTMCTPGSRSMCCSRSVSHVQACTPSGPASTRLKLAMPAYVTRSGQSVPAATAARGSTPRDGVPVCRSARFNTSAVTPVRTSETHQLPPATWSRPPTTPGWAGHHSPGGSNARETNSSRMARMRTGSRSAQRVTTVHTRTTLARLRSGGGVDVPDQTAGHRWYTCPMRRGRAVGAVVAGLLFVIGQAPPALPARTATTPAQRSIATIELPRGGRVILGHYRVVAYYGVPGSSALGILGSGTPEHAALAIARRAAAFKPYGKTIQPAMEIIATVAQASAGADGDSSAPVSITAIKRYIAAAHRHKMLVILDLQPGRASFLSQVRKL